MSLRDSLKDIIKYTHGLGFINMVKLIGDNTTTKVEAIDDDKTVVLYGTLYQPIAELEATIGLSRIAVLKGYLEYAPFECDKSKLAIITQERAGVEVPVELSFDSGAKHVANYRFMSEDMANEQIKVPPFRGVKWNVSITPSKATIRDLVYFNSILGSFESTFTVSTKDDTLYFSIGSGPTDRSTIPFATNITGSMAHQWSWPLAQVISILKLSDAAECTMSFSDQGALRIELDSGVGKYEYILPARQK
jgi:hypothetical protein